MSNRQIDSSMVYTLFEEINKKLDSKSEQSETLLATPTISDENIVELKEAVQAISEAAKQVKVPEEHIHKHTLDFKANWVWIALVVAIVGLIVMIWVVYNQHRTISQLRDNDLKYRYIKMHGSASEEEVAELEDIFVFQRDNESIKLIRKQVEEFEYLVLEEAKRSEQARLNATRAEQLRQEAETVKGNR